MKRTLILSAALLGASLSALMQTDLAWAKSAPMVSGTNQPNTIQDAGDGMDKGDGMGMGGEDEGMSKREQERAEKRDAKRRAKGKGRATSTRELPNRYKAPGKPGVPDLKTAITNKRKEIQGIAKLIRLDDGKSNTLEELAVEAETQSIALREDANERYDEIEVYARELMADLCDVRDEKVDPNYIHLSIATARQPSTRWVSIDPATKEPRESSFVFLCEELGLAHDDVRPVMEDLQGFIEKDNPYDIWTRIKSVQDEAMESVKDIFTPEEYVTFMLVAGVATPEGDEVVISKVYLDTLRTLGLGGRAAKEIQAVYGNHEHDYSDMRKRVEAALSESQLKKLNKKLERAGLLKDEAESADLKK